jgi:hypothetical protein
VFKEIASILNIESADTHTPGWFQLRTKASKNVINAMAEDERKDLEIAADRMQKDGMPPDIQRRYVPVVAHRRPNDSGPGRVWPIHFPN